MLLEMSESVAVHFIFEHEYVEFWNTFRNSIKTIRCCSSESFSKIFVANGRRNRCAIVLTRSWSRCTIMIDDKNRDVYEYIVLFACQWVMVERSNVPHDWYDARPHTPVEPPRVQMRAVARATRYFCVRSPAITSRLAIDRSDCHCAFMPNRSEYLFARENETINSIDDRVWTDFLSNSRMWTARINCAVIGSI